MALEKILRKIYKYFLENQARVGILIALIALGISIFNTYQIKSGGYAGVPGEPKIEAPEKILKELPKDAPFLGNPDAKVTVVEFSDFQCPYCYRFHSQTFPQLKAEYIDTNKIKFVYINFPILGPESKAAAGAARCAMEQGKFWEYHNELFKNQRGENLGQFDSTNLQKFAGNIGLDIPVFKSCVSSGKYDKMLDEELALGKKFGVRGTPNFFIGDQVIKGAYGIEYFQKFINNQL